MADAIMRKFLLQLLGNASAILGNYPLQKTPFCIIFAINDKVKRIFNWKIIEKMSLISFYVYIWHYSLLLCWRLIHDKYLSMINIESYITMLSFMIITWVWGIIWYCCFGKTIECLFKKVKKMF